MSHGRFELIVRPGTEVPQHARGTFERLGEYFTEDRVLTQLVPFMDDSGVSGRMCDYLMTTYSMKYSCPVGDSDVRHLYELALKEAHGRRFFDPFNRTVSGIPVRFVVPVSGNTVTSTVAQMNFVRWFYTFRINEFIAANKVRIAQDMRSTYRRINLEKKTLSQSGEKRKRPALIGPNSKRRIVLFSQTVVIVPS